MENNWKTQPRRQSAFSASAEAKIKKAAEGTYCNKAHEDNLIDILRQIGKRWFAEDNSARELIQFAEHIRLKFGYLALDEITLAFELVITGELQQDYQPKAITFKYLNHCLKTYAGTTFKLKHPDNIIERTGPQLPPSTDEDYYNALIDVMEGRRSERHRLAYPHITDEAHLYSFNKHDQMIPMLWAWEAVSRHLVSIGELGSEDKKGKSGVILWLQIKYPNATEQSDLFRISPVFGSGIGGRLKQTIGI